VLNWWNNMWAYDIWPWEKPGAGDNRPVYVFGKLVGNVTTDVTNVLKTINTNRWLLYAGVVGLGWYLWSKR